MKNLSIGINIKRAREAMGLSQYALANKVNVSQEMICQVERGRKSPSVALLADIAAVFGCTMDDLVKVES